MSLRRALVTAALLALAAPVACSAASDSGGTIGIATSFNVVTFEPADRVPAPPVEGDRLGGGSPIGPIAGKVAVVNFWGSWCGPCRLEEPELESLWQRFGARGVAFTGVNTRHDQEAAALAFLDEFDVTYPSIFDPDSRLAQAFGVRVMPQTFVIDRDGRIAAQVIGALRSARDLASILKAELR